MMKRNHADKLLSLLLAGTLVSSAAVGLAACKEKEPTPPVHTHTFAEGWSHNDTEHWHAATCDHAEEREDVATHVYDREVAEADYLATAATCTEPAKYYLSCVCGAKGTETFAFGEADGQHTFNTSVWEHDATHHWHPAICGHAGEKGSYEQHTFTNNADGAKRTCSECKYSEYLFDELASPQDLAYADRAITFRKVQYAVSYHVEIKADESKVAEKDVPAGTEETVSVSIDGFGKELVGDYTVTVTAICDDFTSDPATATIKVSWADKEVLIEAEDAILNEKHYHAEANMHGGAFAENFNDAGQGLYLRYFAYEAGTKKVTIRYATNEDDPYVDIYVNKEGETATEKQARVVFPEKTGWFGDIKGADTETELTFTQGWNEIYVLKPSDTTQTPNYGGHVQFDYFVIAGSDKEYDPASVDKAAKSYRLEAEVAEWRWTNAKQRPSHWSAFSLGFGLGEMNAAGDGVKFRFKVAESGTYKVQLALGGSGSVQLNVSINGEEATEKTVRTGSAWNIVGLDDGFTVELTAGEWVTIDFLRTTAWYNPDYLLITPVEA